MAVIWWAANIAQSGYISGLYLTGLIIFGVAAPEMVFRA